MSTLPVINDAAFQAALTALPDEQLVAFRALLELSQQLMAIARASNWNIQAVCVFSVAGALHFEACAQSQLLRAVHGMVGGALRPSDEEGQT